MSFHRSFFGVDFDFHLVLERTSPSPTLSHRRNVNVQTDSRCGEGWCTRDRG
eukprot:CAMPEP_0170779574 /NCGR_PEP_ID=MMETSP0733-20121128/13060_1 /TAXON_ID=186038 /ORGANISM="Fragilariopsis kerguelensis, Strain L26-C5" /LENGTH=51 /DNA_ID=CAMNT_0011123199 /DNA_START=1064 /DNA_END=1215 /DNA_ORIENTATION=-